MKKKKEVGSGRDSVKPVTLNLSLDLNKALHPILNLSEEGRGIDEDDGKPQDSRCFDRDTNRGLHDANPLHVGMVVTFERQREHRLVGFKPNYICGFNHFVG